MDYLILYIVRCKDIDQEIIVSPFSYKYIL